MSPNTHTTPGTSSRTPRRRLLLDSVENSPQSPTSSFSPAQFHRRFITKMLFSPEPSPEDVDDVTTSVQKMRLEDGNRYFFPRSSSLKNEADGRPCKDFPTPLSPIQTGDVSNQRDRFHEPSRYNQSANGCSKTVDSME